MTPEERFWSFVSKDCWLWLGCKDKWGYGQYGVKARRVQAHRHSYMLAYGPIPDGKLVMHTCDVPSCVRPDHLRLGTDADNMADKVAKGRHRSEGERNIHAKLTDAKVREIRKQFVRVNERKSNIREMAKRYGVTPGAIREVVLNLTWTHVK